MQKIRCPRCGQRDVVNATVKPLKFEIVICPECEALWGRNTPIAKETFFNFYSFVADHNLPWSWDIVEIATED